MCVAGFEFDYAPSALTRSDTPSICVSLAFDLADEALEYQNFPFSRQAFQVRVGLKFPIQAMLPVPYNCVLPPFVLEKGPDGQPQVGQTLLRRNLYKHTSDTIGCWKLASHCLMFTPKRFLPRMPSYHKYAYVTVALYMDQMPSVFAWNSFMLVFLLTSLGFAVGIGYGSSEVSVNSLLTLILTMAATKTGMMTWVPLTGRLTTMERHVLLAFGLHSFLAGFVSIDLLCFPEDARLEYQAAQGVSALTNSFSFDLYAWYDRIVFAVFAIFWLLLHAVILWKVLIGTNRRLNPWMAASMLPHMLTSRRHELDPRIQVKYGSWKVPWTEVVAREDAQVLAWQTRIESFFKHPNQALTAASQDRSSWPGVPSQDLPCRRATMPPPVALFPATDPDTRDVQNGQEASAAASSQPTAKQVAHTSSGQIKMATPEARVTSAAPSSSAAHTNSNGVLADPKDAKGRDMKATVVV